MKKLNTALIGLGSRGYSLLGMLCHMDTLQITAVCDVYSDRVSASADFVARETGTRPFEATDYKKVLTRDDVDAVLIVSAWESHIPIALDAFSAHKAVGMEVGGAYSVNDCITLVKEQEKTGTPFMFLENCCYGRYEMMVMRMVSEGLFGKVVHCEGGYRHDLRDEILLGEENRHYRLRNYISRNCENYPTHELGPIAKILGINDDNRMLSLVSSSTDSFGLNDFAQRFDNIRPELKTQKFSQGDVVTTMIKCSLGQTVILTLDTSLPRPYSRMFTVQGTQGMYSEEGNYIFLDRDHRNTDHFNIKQYWNNADTYFEKYEHPVWDRFLHDGVRGGHGGMDYLVYNEFAECVLDGRKPPIDVYDGAAWMCITPLSEISLANNSSRVEIPDFKNL